jgi:hypothetical protein
MNNYVTKIDELLLNQQFSIIIEIFLIIYTIFIAPNMLHPSISYTKNIIYLFNNSIFKILIFLIIGYISQINLRLSLFLTIAYFISNDIINKYNTNRKVLKLIKNREIKINQINLKPSEIIRSKSSPYISYKTTKTSKISNSYKSSKSSKSSISDKSAKSAKSAKSSILSKLSRSAKSAKSSISDKSTKSIESYQLNQLIPLEENFNLSNLENGFNQNVSKFAEINFND